jgi:sulfur-oxidizing protein SoxB
MNLNRREFIRLLGLAGAAGMFPGAGFSASSEGSRLYDMPAFGNARILHFTDCHAQLNPIYFREPSVNLGIGDAFGKAPHLVGKNLVKQFGIAHGGIEEHAYTYINFEEAARTFGKIGYVRNMRRGIRYCSMVVTPGRVRVPLSGPGDGIWSRPVIYSELIS